MATVNEEVYWSFDHDINDMTSVLCPAHIIYCPAATDPQQVAVRLTFSSIRWRACACVAPNVVTCERVMDRADGGPLPE